MITATRRRTAVAIAGATAGLAGVVVPSAGAYAATPSSAGTVGTESVLGDRVAQKATDELNATGHNVESPLGSNCNYYSGFFNVGSTNCPSGYRGQEWCADFARYTWKAAGVRDWQNTNSLASSFRDYGVNHGTWHKGTAGIQAGDAAVYDGHVGVVVVADGNNSLVVSGNWGNRVTKHHILDAAGFQGYSRPLG